MPSLASRRPARLHCSLFRHNDDLPRGGYGCIRFDASPLRATRDFPLCRVSRFCNGYTCRTRIATASQRCPQQPDTLSLLFVQCVRSECLKECICPPAPASPATSNDDGPFVEPIHPSQGASDQYRIRKQNRKRKPSESRRKDATRKRAAMARESEKKSVERKSKNSRRMEAARANETMEQRVERKSKNSYQMEAARANENEEQRVERQSKDSKAHEVARANETEKQRVERQSKDSKAHKIARANESEEHAKRRKANDNMTHRQKRLREKDRKAEVHKGCIQDEATELLDPAGRKEREKGAGDRKFCTNGRSYLGEMDKVCGFCQGRGWELEFKTDAKEDDGDKIKKVHLEYRRFLRGSR